MDVQGYRPQRGELDKHGHAIDGRLYNEKDFDRTLVIDDRTRRVAKWVSDYLKQSGDRLQKTIVFCVDTEHAARMRQALVNENADLVQQNARYVMRITGDDAEGAAQLGNFIDPYSKWPVIVTTSRLLSTGVDAQTCRLIVLDREVGSMTEFVCWGRFQRVRPLQPAKSRHRSGHGPGTGVFEASGDCAGWRNPLFSRAPDSGTKKPAS